MKKIAMCAAVLALVLAHAAADDWVVSADALPKAAKDFITANFPGKNVTFVEQEFNEFEVYLDDRTELKFRGNGDWKTIKCYSGVPAGALPQGVSSYMASNFAGVTVYEVEKEPRRIEAKLANGLEVYFDGNGKFLGQKYDD